MSVHSEVSGNIRPLTSEPVPTDKRMTINIEKQVIQEAYTLEEVAAILSLSKRTVESLIARRELASFNPPGTKARRISRLQLNQYLEKADGIKRQA